MPLGKCEDRSPLPERSMDPKKPARGDRRCTVGDRNIAKQSHRDTVDGPVKMALQLDPPYDSGEACLDDETIEDVDVVSPDISQTNQ